MQHMQWSQITQNRVAGRGSASMPGSGAQGMPSDARSQAKRRISRAQRCLEHLRFTKAESMRIMQLLDEIEKGVTDTCR